MVKLKFDSTWMMNELNKLRDHLAKEMTEAFAKTSRFCAENEDKINRLYGHVEKLQKEDTDTSIAIADLRTGLAELKGQFEHTMQVTTARIEQIEDTLKALIDTLDARPSLRSRA